MSNPATLPNLLSVAGAWAQLVALSPVLSLFDNSEVEIMNENIPEYGGAAGFIGQMLALFLVAIGSVKRFYQTNEAAAEERRRSARSATFLQLNEDDLLKAVQTLDHNQCIFLFMCSLAFRLKDTKLTPLQESLMMPFGKKPSRFGSTPDFNFAYATYIGLHAKTEATCSTTFEKCPFQPQQMSKGLKWLQKMNPENWHRIVDFITSSTTTSGSKFSGENFVLQSISYQKLTRPITTY